MSSPGGQGGAGSSPNGGSGDRSSQGNPSQTTTTTEATFPGFGTSTSSPFTSTTQTHHPISSISSSSSSSSSSKKTAIIGGVVGGIAGLLVVSLVAIWFLNRRKKRQIAVKDGLTQPVTYANLNPSISRIPFGHNLNRRPQDGLTPVPLLNSSTSSSHPDIEMRGGNSSLERHSTTESDMFLPTYAESQAAISVGGTPALGRLNTSHGSNSTNVSPLSATGTQTVHNLSSDLPPLPALPQRDTMRSPIETGLAPPDFETIHLQPEMPLPIVAPIPRHPLVHQDSWERQVRQGAMPTDSPEPPEAINSNRLRVLSQEIPRESPILGFNSVSIQPHTDPSNQNPSPNIDRMASQRTVSSMSSMPAVVSDVELENLGIGTSRRNFNTL